MESPVRRVTLLGAAGSIGSQTLDVFEEYAAPRSVFAVVGGENPSALAAAAVRAKAERAVIANPAHYTALRDALAGTNVHAMAGEEAVMATCAERVDWLLCAISGYAALKPLWHAIPSARAVALANKEALVCAGDALRELARRHGCALIPVDSEHAALFRLLRGANEQEAVGATITASGGAVRDLPLDALADVTPDIAGRHPVWSMGVNITVDSATMMNKGLETIEACRLYPFFSSDDVEAVLHREALVHGAVHWRDGGTSAYVSPSDMRLSIAQAWFYPDAPPFPPPSLPKKIALTSMTFEPICPTRYPCYYMARKALTMGGLAPAILNAANERARKLFLAGKIRFTDIAPHIAEALERVPPGEADSPESVEEAVARFA
ncbi:MAG: hypothetical protein ABW189_07180 [Rickettsiales bacterium]